MNTSIRGRGKWGDFLVAIIPLTWCGSILVNSNFILRMIEWQNEESLFTLRVVGKQWFWEYSYDATSVASILSAPKNIGHNNWFFTHCNESYCSNSYYEALSLGMQLELKKTRSKKFFEDTKTKYTKPSNENVIEISILPNPADLPNDKTSQNENQNISSTNGEYIELLKNISILSDGEAEKYLAAATENMQNAEENSVTTNNENTEVIIKELAIKNPILDSVGLENTINDKNSSPADVEVNEEELNYETLSDEYIKEKETKEYFIKNPNAIANLEEDHVKKTVSFSMLSDKGETVILPPTQKYYPTPDLTSFSNIASIDNCSGHEVGIRLNTKKVPLSILAGVLNKHNLDIIKNSNYSLDKPILFVLKFLLQDGTFQPRQHNPALFWGFKGKRYERKSSFMFHNKTTYDPKCVNMINTGNFTTPSGKLISPLTLKSELSEHAGHNDKFFKTSNFFRKSFYDLQSLGNSKTEGKDNQKVKFLNTDSGEFNSGFLPYQTSLRKNRHRGELVPVTLARRLLRTKRVLVLPAHINITVLTTSWDVVHSWFIPGLGIKLDCVPGRSTHHSFYIDNIGFYYGQCAEICGRYHHHMPIRLCALPFEQFLVWWQHKGLRRFHRLPNTKNKQGLTPEVNKIKTQSLHNVDELKFRYKW